MWAKPKSVHSCFAWHQDRAPSSLQHNLLTKRTEATSPKPLRLRPTISAERPRHVRRELELGLLPRVLPGEFDQQLEHVQPRFRRLAQGRLQFTEPTFNRVVRDRHAPWDGTRHTNPMRPLLLPVR